MSVVRQTRLFLEMIRFSHTVFALPFALLAAVMAWRADGAGAAAWRWQDLAGIVLCMVFARSTAMAVNRLADRRFDAMNERTKRRHLPSRTLSVGGVAAFAALSAAAFVASTLVFLPNRWPVILSVPVLAFLCGYSFAKRFTPLVHFWLGAALGLAPIAAWLAVTGQLAWPPAVLGLAVMLWVAGFDIIYACQDVETDRRLGLFSVPASIGAPAALRVAAACHLLMVVVLAAMPLVYPSFGWVYTAGIIVVAALLAYEHAIIRADDLTRVNVAFFNVNAVVSLGLLAIGAVDLLT